MPRWSVLRYEAAIKDEGWEPPFAQHRASRPIAEPSGTPWSPSPEARGDAPRWR